jgi:hypothetical protein
LSAAEGEVKCGFCGRQFNALNRLRDQPLDQGEISALVKEQQESPVKGKIEIENDRQPSEADENVPTSDVIEHVSESFNLIDDNFDEEPEFQIEGELSSKETAELTDSDINSNVTQAYEIDEPLDQELIVDDKQLEDIPDILLEDKKAKSGFASRLFFAILALVLLGVVGGQAAWFQRDKLISDYPELIPIVVNLCSRFDCDVIRFRDVNAIELINRDVREHPRYEKALLVNATMSNQSPTRQAFPNIRLSLFDTEGALIGHRIFAATEYLDDSIDLIYGMSPGIPVHFVLEVTGDTEGAVSFEFDFL